MKKLILVLLFILCACQSPAPSTSVDLSDPLKSDEAFLNAVMDVDYEAALPYMNKQTAEAVFKQFNNVAQTYYKDAEITLKGTSSLNDRDLYYTFLRKDDQNYRSVVSFDDDGLILSWNIVPGNPDKALSTSDTYTEERLYGGYDSLLRGVITLPNNDIEGPIVLLVQGSGPSDYDESVEDRAPFSDIAHALAQSGIPSVRFDKRTFAFPEMFANTDNITLDNEYFKDINAHIDWLNKAYPNRPIYLLGHSQGAMLAPYIASTRTEIKGLILMAGTPRSLVELMADQNLSQALLMSNNDSYNKVKETFERNIAEIKALKGNEDGMILNLPKRYWAELNQTQANLYLPDIDIPLLVMQGEQDIQVFADKDYLLMQEALQGKSNASFILYPALNHFFSEENENMVDAQVLNDLVIFISGIK